MTLPTMQEWAALVALRRTAVRGQGWRYQGVRGWMLAAEVDDAAGTPTGAALRALTMSDLVSCADVRGPGRNQPIWLYRITEAGLRMVEEREDLPPRLLTPVCRDMINLAVDKGVFFLARAQWDALHALQAVQGDQGWPFAEVAARAPGLRYPDLLHLQQRGLIRIRRDQRAATLPSRYVATPLGMRVLHAAPPQETWVQVRLHAAPPVARDPELALALARASEAVADVPLRGARRIDVAEFVDSAPPRFAGREAGRAARERARLDELDHVCEVVVVHFSEEALGVNASFFRAMFSPSVVALGEVQFRRHYRFTGLDVTSTCDRAIRDLLDIHHDQSQPHSQDRPAPTQS